MSKEQNIDDILKLLRDSVSVENSEAQEETTLMPEQNNISHEDIQEQLKSHYLDGNSSAVPTYESQREYVIDSDFLTQLKKEPESNNDDESVFKEEPVNVDEIADNIVQADTGTSYADSVPKDNIMNDNQDNQYSSEMLGGILVKEDDQEIALSDDKKTEQFAVAHDEDEDENLNNAVISENDEDHDDIQDDHDSDVELINEEYSSEYDALEIGELSDESIDVGSQTQREYNSIHEIVDENESESDEYESIVFSDERIDDKDLLIIEETEKDDAVEEAEKNAPYETFLASMRKTGMDFTTDDIYKSAHDKSDDTEDTEEAVDDSFVQNSDNTADDVKIEISEEDVESDELDMSTINIMMQFCEKEELEETIGNNKVEEFLIYEQTEDVQHSISEKVLDGKEYVSESQNERIFDTYKKSRMRAMWSMIGCSVIAVIAFIFELLPILDLRLSGALDYYQYPAIYALVGLQFVVFAAAICYKQLWLGLKRAFSFAPNTHSVVAIILALTAIYDLVIVIVLAFSGDDLPTMYNGVAVVITAIVAVSDYLDILSEERAFSVYSASARKYTLLRETPRTGIGAKMYGGGLEKSKAVYSAHSVDFPRGFFRSVNAKGKNTIVWTTTIIPVIVIGMIAAIVSVVLGADAYASCAAFMLALYALLPISFIFSDSVSNMIAYTRLANRGSAIAGKGSIDTYSECDIMVFGDTHLFKKCKTDEVGFAIYDTSVGYLVLGCLDALFSYIGGPLSGMKMESLPDVFRFRNVKVKRIARNGVEAVIENRHSIIVGDHEFMKRYGLVFPENETETGRSTLCVSLNGKVTAKLSVRYETEPVFEMLVERLYAEGVSVAVRTADPMINSKMAAAARTVGNSPISVIHLSVDDIDASRGNYREEADGVISCQSRLKLGEVMVWIKKMKRIRKLSGFVATGFSVVGALALILLVIFGATGFVNQLYVLLYLLLELGAISAVMVALFPSKDYFTVDALYSDFERAHQKEQKAINKNN